MKVGDLVRFRSTGHLATVLRLHTEEPYLEDHVKLFVHGGVLKDTPSSDGITYMGIEKLRRVAEKVS